MTFEAHAAAFADDMDIFAQPVAAPSAFAFAPRAVPAEPEAGWATRNPDRALLLLFVDPRDCAMVDELMAA
jgi:hypothetical protein